MVLQEALGWGDTHVSMMCPVGYRMEFKHVSALDGAGDTAQWYPTSLARWGQWAPVRTTAKNKMTERVVQGASPSPFPHLLHIKDDDEFQGGDCREEWGEEGSDPADGLAVHDAKDVVRDGKLLLPPALDQLRGGTVGH